MTNRGQVLPGHLLLMKSSVLRSCCRLWATCFFKQLFVFCRLPQAEKRGSSQRLLPQARPADPRGRAAAGPAAEGQRRAAGPAAGPRPPGAGEGRLRLPGTGRGHSALLQKGEAASGGRRGASGRREGGESDGSACLCVSVWAGGLISRRLPRILSSIRSCWGSQVHTQAWKESVWEG